MDVSVGVMAYNEERNIAQLLKSLLKQKLSCAKIKEIIVVSSGSTDNTNAIVKSFPEVKLVVESERKGKTSAINKFLEAASSETLALISADTVAEESAIESLCRHFSNKNIGVVCARPMPKTSENNFINYLVNLQWSLHHQIALQKPKCGEMIAFRNIFSKIDNTAVDEEQIAMMIDKAGYNVIYEPNAIVYNHGPKTIKDFFKQRRRIYCGHLEMKNEYNYEVSTLSNLKILRILLTNIDLKSLHSLFLAVSLECFGRALGLYDFLTNKEKHYIWDIAGSTKV